MRQDTGYIRPDIKLYIQPDILPARCLANISLISVPEGSLPELCSPNLLRAVIVPLSTNVNPYNLNIYFVILGESEVLAYFLTSFAKIIILTSLSLPLFRTKVVYF